MLEVIWYDSGKNLCNIFWKIRKMQLRSGEGNVVIITRATRCPRVILDARERGKTVIKISLQTSILC